MLTSYVLADAVGDARDVVETFRQGTLLQDWEATLLHAADAIERTVGDIGGDESLPLAGLAVGLRRLVSQRLESDQALLLRVSRELETLVDRSRPAGLPGPDDSDWTF
jgi:hypothetical protein